jgi:Zn-dependent protease
LKRFFNNPVALILIMIMAVHAVKSGRYSSPADWLLSTLIILPGIIIGISFHEYAHAKVAAMCGDSTPVLGGRVTVNPMVHIDPIGFIALLFIGFGWGRPVSINPLNFRKPRLYELFVALAGVTVNLMLAFLFFGILRLLYEFVPMFMYSDAGSIATDILIHVVLINLVLLVFNLLPIPPLDGFNVITQIFNLRNTEFYYRIYDKGFLILMVLIIFNVTGKVLTPSVFFLYNLLAGIFF